MIVNLGLLHAGMGIFFALVTLKRPLRRRTPPGSVDSRFLEASIYPR